MTIYVDIMPTDETRPETPRRRHVTTLAYDRMATFEFSIPVEVFGLPRPYLDPWYRFSVCAVEAGPLRATGGIRIMADGGLELLDEADVVFVPGWRDLDDPPPRFLLDGLIRAHERGAVIATICSGCFLLAWTGLLDGRRATTHWQHTDRLRRLFPKIDVDPDVLFVDEGSLLTSAGSAAGLDLCLHIVRRDFGAAVAARLAKRLVIYPHRDGGQAQFIDHGIVDGPADRLEAVGSWLLDNLRQTVSLDDMASRAGLSRRTFIRRFKARFGSPPHAWLQRQRVARAQQMLAGGTASVETIAGETGFGSAAMLRHHFRQAIGISPQSYRRRFAMERATGA